jgi:ketosteroid isomerase-like protein
MSQENVEIVRAIYAEWQLGNMKAGTERFDPEIVFESFVPDASGRIVASGPAEVEVFMREFLRQWRAYRIVGEEYREIDSTTIFVGGHQTAIGRESGVAVEDTLFSIWTFRDGKVVHLIFERHRERALEAIGLSEQDAHADS